MIRFINDCSQFLLNEELKQLRKRREVDEKVDDMPSHAEYDIAVIGLGPVGCTAAILLAEAGLRVVAVERDEDVYALPRAVNLDGEVIRAFQGVGRGQTVQDLMQSVRPGDRAGFANSRREWLFGSEAKRVGRNGWQPANMFDQPEFEAYLRKEAIRHPNVTAHIGAEMLGAQQNAQLVDLHYARPDGTEAHTTARYLIACDGASSGVRKSLDIGWVDLGYDHHWLVVDVIVSEGHTLDNSTVQVCDPDRIQTYVATKDPFRRWEFKLLPDETPEDMLAPEKIMALIDPWTPRDTYEIRRAAVYQFHAANADRWRDGRIFIAGDAAHQTPPFLGQGMNTGMRDVINLAWKLPIVVGGVATESLLDTYFEERAAHAHDLVDWAVSIGRLMEHIAEQERCAREGLDPPDTPPALQSAGYGQGREQPPIRGGVVMTDQVSDTGFTGYLLSQPLVRTHTKDADDTDIRLDELMGNGFALLVAEGAHPTWSAASEKILRRLNVQVVRLSDLSLVSGRFDGVFELHECALVRPDRIIFGHNTEQVSPDQLIHSLAEKLCLAAPIDNHHSARQTV